MRTARRHFTYANVIATIALVLALGGTATAAAKLITGAQIKNETLTAADVKNNSLTGGDIKNDSLTAADFSGSLPAGTKGDPGADGAAGTKGDRGEQGIQGIPGLQGIQGIQGVQGEQGEPGPDADGATVTRLSADGTALENGTALRAALDDIPSLDPPSPRVVYLAAGTYDVGTSSLVLADGLTLIGAGRKSTTIRNSGAGSNALMAMGLRSELRAVSVTATGTRRGISTGLGDALLSDVSVTSQVGLTLDASETIDVVNSEFVSYAGSQATVSIAGGQANFRGSSIRSLSSSPTAAALASPFTSTTFVETSAIYSLTAPAVAITEGNVFLGASRVQGTITEGTGAAKCTGVYNGDFDPILC